MSSAEAALGRSLGARRSGCANAFMPGAGYSAVPTPQRRSVAHNAVARAVGEIIAKLASVAFFVAVARELGEESFGDFMFALSFTTVLLLAAGFGTEELVAREVARDRSRLDEYLSNTMVGEARNLGGAAGVRRRLRERRGL